MKAFSLFLCLFAFGACRPKQKFQCNMDIQCGVGAYCENGGCLVPAANCGTGYRDYSSANCVQPPSRDAAVAIEGDMAEALPEDMAEPPVPDMAVAVDMTITCAQQGQVCTVGKGACARMGTVVCTMPNVANCNAMVVAPDSTWHAAAAANGSYDWDCDGIVQYQYPAGNTTQPTDGMNQCTEAARMASQSACESTLEWIWQGDAHGCGYQAYAISCMWVVIGSNPGFCETATVQQKDVVVGCH